MECKPGVLEINAIDLIKVMKKRTIQNVTKWLIPWLWIICCGVPWREPTMNPI